MSPHPALLPPLQDNSHVDLEALESENDRGIAALSERVGALRGITSGIHGEVESQHRLLDGMVSGNNSPPLLLLLQDNRGCESCRQGY